MSTDTIKSFVKYKYMDGHLIISFKQTPLFKVKLEERKDMVPYVKDNQDRILANVLNTVKSRGLVA